jgi:pimeloyl-ACP methyl ester carboxylesterase
MQRRALELEAAAGAVDSTAFVRGVADRVREVRAPTLVVYGDEDVDDFRTIAARLAAEIRDAALVRIPGAAHLPSLEQPAAFDAAVLPFLRRALYGCTSE